MAVSVDMDAAIAFSVGEMTVPTWNSFLTDIFDNNASRTAPTSTGAANSTSGVGSPSTFSTPSTGGLWTEVHGGVYSINSGNKMLVAPTTGTTFNTTFLTRPSGENLVDGRVVVTLNNWTMGSTGSGNFGIVMRSTGSGTYYLFLIGAAAINTYYVTGGTAHAIGSQAVTMIGGHDYTLDAQCYGGATSGLGGSTTVYLQLIDTTSTITLATLSNTDTNGPTAAGQFALTSQINTPAQTYTVNSVQIYQAQSSSYSLTGPSYLIDGVASANFTVTSGGSLGSGVTVTPSDGGAGGTFTPTTVTLAAGTNTSATLTYTPLSSATGNITVSTTNNGSLLDPSGLVLPSKKKIPVTDTNWYWAPYATFSNGSGTLQSNNILPGSTAAGWVNNGNKSMLGFTGTSCILMMDMTNTDGSNLGQLLYSVNGGAQQLASSTALTTVATGLSAGNHLVEFWSYGSYESNNAWTIATSDSMPANRVKFTGALIDGGASSIAPSSATKPPPITTLNMLVLGDSISEGSRMLANSANISGGQDGTQSYANTMGKMLKANVGMVAWDGQGLIVAAQRSVPACYNASLTAAAWSNYFNGTSRLVGGLLSPAPDMIIVNQGTNDGYSSANTATFQASYTALLTQLRTAAPNALIVCLVPFGGWYRTYVLAATLPDSNSMFIDLGTQFQQGLTNVGASFRSWDGLHPNVRTHADAAAQIGNQVYVALNNLSTTLKTRTQLPKRGR